MENVRQNLAPAQADCRADAIGNNSLLGGAEIASPARRPHSDGQRDRDDGLPFAPNPDRLRRGQPNQLVPTRGRGLHHCPPIGDPPHALHGGGRNKTRCAG